MLPCTACMKYHLKEAWGSFEPSPSLDVLTRSKFVNNEVVRKGKACFIVLPRSLVVRGATLKVQWSRMAVRGVRAGSSLSVGTLCGGRGWGRLGNQQVWILLRTVTHQPSDLM